jgi:hypothetical protein
MKNPKATKNSRPAVPAKQQARRPGQAVAVQATPEEVAQLAVIRAKKALDEAASHASTAEDLAFAQIQQITDAAGVRDKIQAIERGRARARLIRERAGLMHALAEVELELVKLGNGGTAQMKPAKPAAPASPPPTAEDKSAEKA